MKRSLLLVAVLALLGSATAVNASRLASIADVKTALKQNPFTKRLSRDAATLGAVLLLSMPAVPAEVLAKDLTNPASADASASSSANDGVSHYDELVEASDYDEGALRELALLAETTYGINGTDDHGMHPLDYALFFASYRGDIRVAKEMVARGADLTLVDEEAHGDLIELAAKLADGKAFLSIAEEYYGGIADVVKARGDTLLQAAVTANNASVVEILLDHGTDPNAAIIHAADIYHRTGVSTLKMYVNDPNSEMLTLLLNRGANANFKHRKKFTPMHIAANTGNSLGVTALIQHGGNPNIVDAYGATALHASLYRAQVYSGFRVARDIFVMTNVLLAHNVDVHVKDSDGLTAYDYAVEEFNSLSPHRDERPLFAATAAILLKAMVGAEGTDAKGRTPMDWALLSGSEIVQATIKSESKFIPISGGQEEEILNAPVIREMQQN